jgi:hypothetical protein
VQQARLVKVFATSAAPATVAAYSVGQQLAIAAFTALTGLAAVVFIFRFRSFKEVITAGRASREAERAAERAGVLLVDEGGEDERRFDQDAPPPGAPRPRSARY